MSSLLDSARSLVHQLISLQNIPLQEITEKDIKNQIEKIKKIPDFEEVNVDDLFSTLLADYRINGGGISQLTEDLPKWVKDFRANNSMPLWNRYKLLLQKDPKFPILELDDFTDIILDKCVDPRIDNDWDRRGMVVGHVQSGKTSNYIGLINKATDAGYKLIIVIAGTISSLRRQTQERIDEGFIGRDSSTYIQSKSKSSVIGVGRYSVETDIYSFTSTIYDKGKDGDFNQSIASRLGVPLGKNPVVLVIKKNKNILENLIEWLSKNENYITIEGESKLINCPTLVIDDEADSASVNASKSIEEIKTINRLIRTLLSVFSQKTFIGYTATPFANLFIPQEYDESVYTLINGKKFYVGNDLFPRDFIINIKAPSNYIGSTKIFGYENEISGEITEPLDIFRPIFKEEYDPPFFTKVNKENKLILPEILPGSIDYAMKSFFLTCAIRRVRGQKNSHNSMLIHVALLVAWIDRISKLVNERFTFFKDCIEAQDEEFINSLKDIFESDFKPTTKDVLKNLTYEDPVIKEHSWEEVYKELRPAILKIEVRAVHGKRNTSGLEYHNIEEINYNSSNNGLSIIAVGGNKLSRGITLNGLSVSYYLRTTKMYDSLMQMGRWFGYRPGYVDLCRLFTNENIYNWFNHVNIATEEMRLDFDELTSSNKKPKDFNLKVRNHPGLMTITSVAKLHFAKELKISFSNTNPQTYLLSKQCNIIESNFKAFNKLILNLGEPKDENIVYNKTSFDIRYLLYKDVDKNYICNFLEEYISTTPKIENSNFSEYISSQSEIKSWNVALVSNTDKKASLTEGKKDKLVYEIDWGTRKIVFGQSVRNVKKEERSLENYRISKNQIDDTKDRQVDLGTEFKSNAKIKEERRKRKQGLLLLYALDERGANVSCTETPIVGYSIHFPEIENEKKITYMATIYNDFDEESEEEETYES